MAGNRGQLLAVSGNIAVWTPKRVLILFGGFGLFAVLFAVYSFALGRYDGLPALPEKYLRRKTASPSAAAVDATAKKLIEAFGPDCEEWRHILLYLKTKGFLVSAEKFDIEPDGRVKLSPFSAAVFPKGAGRDKHPEINTVKCDLAFLTLDRPIKSVSEMSARKIISVELRGGGGVTIRNNRKTPQDKTDDIVLEVTNAPLFYDDQRGEIWSEGFVRMTDYQTQPQETKITAKGMKLQLAREGSPGSKGKGRAGRRRQRCRTDYFAQRCGHAFVDGPEFRIHGRSAAVSRQEASAARAGRDSRKGPRRYSDAGPLRLRSDDGKGSFSVRQGEFRGLSVRAGDAREHKVGTGKKHDQLECDDLYLQFRRKPAWSTPTASGSSQHREPDG